MVALLKNSFKYVPVYFILVIWAIHLFSTITDTDLTWLGTHPRHWGEWYTSFTGSLIHGDFEHLLNNTYPLLVTGLFLYFIFGKYSNFVFLSTMALTGLFIFLFARGNTYHIGASGLAYSWAFMLAASGFFRKDRISLGLGLLVVVLYGGMLWGVLPFQPGVSWDGHLIGALTGIGSAYVFKNLNIKKDEEIKPDPELSAAEAYPAHRFEHTQFNYLRRHLKNQEEE